MSDTAITERGILARITERGLVTATASFRLGDPDDLNRAVQFIAEAWRPGDKVRRYIDGETVRLSEPAPEPLRPYREGDCDLCDGWHPIGDHGSSNIAPDSGRTS